MVMLPEHFQWGKSVQATLKDVIVSLRIQLEVSLLNDMLDFVFEGAESQR